VKYSLFILPQAQRAMASLETQDREKIRKAILALQENPRPTHCRKLTGRDGWRMRVGNYRVIYEIDDAARSVTILNVGHRREIYR
jgi:mRNA interferase RelE/StbE